MPDSDLDYAKVTGRLALSVADGSDLGDNPDIIYCDSGTVRITPLINFTRVADATPPFTIGHAAIDATVDTNGYVTWNGQPYVWVVDLTSEKVNPCIPDDAATHKLEFINVMADGTKITFPEATVRFTADGLDGSGVNDLALVMPVTEAASVPIIRGERGVGIQSAAVEGGDLVFGFTDGTEINAGELPVGPGGTDAGVASYLADPGSATATALSTAVVPVAEDAAADYLASSPAVADAAAIAATGAVNGLVGPVSGVVGAMARYNLAPNPGPQVAGGWGAASGTLYSIARDTTQVRRAGTQSSRLTRQNVTLNLVLASWTFVGSVDAVVANLAPVTAGKTYTFSVYCRPPVAAVARITTIYYNASNTVLATLVSGDIPITAGVWTNRPTWTTTAPAGATKRQNQIQFRTADASNATPGQESWIQDAQFEEGSVATPYADGGMAPDGITIADVRWTGTAGQSTTRVTQTVASEVVKQTGTLAPITYVNTVGDAATLHTIRKSDIRRGKGGTLGTNGRAVVNFRIDHGIDPFLADFWPLFKARAIPASVGVVTDAIGNAADAYEPTATTWAQLRAASRSGFEVWSHSCSHRDPATTGGMPHEVNDSRLAVEANGFKCIGWQQPGVSGNTTPNYAGNWQGLASWSSDYGKALLANYGLIEINGTTGALRSLPTFDNYDLGRYTLDNMTIAAAKQRVDQAIAAGMGLQFMVHPRFVNDASVSWTLANMTEILDYVKTKVDAGLLLALTSSGLSFADPGSTRRFDLLVDNDITSLPATAGPTWYASSAANGFVTQGTDGGRGYAQLAADAALGYVYQSNQQLANLVANGHTFMAEVEARAVTADIEIQMTVIDDANSAELNLVKYWALTAGGPWTTYRLPVTIPAISDRATVRIGRRTGSGTLQFRGVRLRPC